MSGRGAAHGGSDDVDRVFHALAHPARRRILTVLHPRADGLTSGAIAERFDCAWPTVTRHLRVLRDAGLVRVEPRGRERAYAVDSARIARVAGGWIGRFGVESGR